MNLSTLITLKDGSKIPCIVFNPEFHEPVSPEHLQQVIQASMDSIKQCAKLRLDSRAHALPAIIEFGQASVALQAILDTENLNPGIADIQQGMAAMDRRRKAEDELFRTLHGAGFSH